MSSSNQDPLKAFHDRLQSAGLKSTRQRDVIAETFFSRGEHISVEELLTEARKKSPRIGYATVYRTLKLLVEQGFAKPRRFDDGQTRYDPHYEEQHDHLICVDCRRIIEFEDSEVLSLLQAVATGHGLEMRSRSLHLYGACLDPECEHRPS